MGVPAKQVDYNKQSLLQTLPGDDIRQIMWRYQDRFDLQMAVQASRSVARNVVAQIVGDGARQTHEWTPEKNRLLEAFDQSGITSVFMDPKYGGFVEGPKNLALSLTAFELAWVDGGAATCSLATNLALAPIHERGTPEQKDYYMSRCVPPQPGEDRTVWRGAFALTEPLPYIGVDTGVVSGRVRVSQWEEGQEPLLQVEKRGRFITNMDFANFITAAVTSDDERIKGSCMVILEETDPGTYDRGAPTQKLVHQLSSTRDPIFNLTVPASRIIGGYTVVDGVIVPNYSHSAVIEAVFLRTRVAPGLMTAAKLLSAVEPIIRYQRQRFHGGSASSEGTPRYDLGLQQKEDALLRLIDIWATGEAAASLGFEASRRLDSFEPLEEQKRKLMSQQGISGGRAELKALKSAAQQAITYLKLKRNPSENTTQLKELEQDPMLSYMLMEAEVNVLVPACKLWNTGHGANMMREALSLMGGYGITEDCPGFLPYKWMDAQLEATYEGPEAVQRRQLTLTMTNEVFLATVESWEHELRQIASERPGTGACTLASAFTLWRWTLKHLTTAKDANGKPLMHGKRQGVTFPLADALCWLLAARSLIMDSIELDLARQADPSLADTLTGFVTFYQDLSHTQTAASAGEASRICAELVFGYNHHPSWEDDSACCCSSAEADTLEATMPGVSCCATGRGEIANEDGTHGLKAGPCVSFEGLHTFNKLRNKLDGCLTGSRLARDRAALAASQVMVPEALDYPQ